VAAGAERARAALVVAVVGEWDAGMEWAADGALSGASWLRSRTAMSSGEAATLVREARLVHAHVATREALGSGGLSCAHLRVLAVAVRYREDLYRESEAVVLDAAAVLSVDEFAVVMRRWRWLADDATGREDPRRRFERRFVHVSTTLWGTARLDGELDGEGGAWVVRALEEFATRDVAGEGMRTPGQRRADALVDLARAALGHSGHPGEVVHGLAVVVDVDTLQRAAGAPPGTPADSGPSTGPSSAGLSRGGPAWGATVSVEGLDPSFVDLIPTARLAGLRCDIAGVGPVPAGTIVRLCCDAAIGRVVVRGRSAVLDLGFRTRVPSPAQRRALAHRDGHCVVPGCDRPPPWCDAHHVVPWPAHGPTDLANLVLLCRRHHVLCHEGGWKLTRAPDGTVTARAPDTPDWVLAA
jgi:hypothetical protein